MELTQILLDFFRKPASETEGKAPQGICSICWGYQQYDKKIRNKYRDRQIDVNNHRDSYTLMEDFVKHHIDGIKLLEGETGDCTSCGCKD